MESNYILRLFLHINESVEYFAWIGVIVPDKKFIIRFFSLNFLEVISYSNILRS